jgi:hypothetical protein
MVSATGVAKSSSRASAIGQRRRAAKKYNSQRGQRTAAQARAKANAGKIRRRKTTNPRRSDYDRAVTFPIQTRESDRARFF